MQAVSTYQISYTFTPSCIALDIFSKYIHGIDVGHKPFRLFSLQENDKSKAKKGGVRGPYRKYTAQEKVEIIERMLNKESLKKIAEETLIPKRNLIRWKHEYLHKKVGTSKSVDSEDEESVQLEIHNEIIRKQTLETKENLSQESIEATRQQVTSNSTN